MIEDQVRQLNEQAEALKAQGECEVEAWLVMNENGDYQLGIDETQAAALRLNIPQLQASRRVAESCADRKRR